MKDKRESGFYWVKYYITWIICEFNNELNCWFSYGNQNKFKDSDFTKINKTKLTPPK